MFDPGLVWTEECSHVGVFKTLVCLEVKCIVFSLMGSTCGSSPISCYSLLPSFPRVVSHTLFFPVMHAHSFSLIFPFHCKPSLCGGGVGGVFCQPYGSARGVRSRCARHWGSAPSSTCVCTHTYTHTQAYTVPGKRSMTDNSVI